MAVLAVGLVGAAAGAGIFGAATFLGVSAAGWGWMIGTTLASMFLKDSNNTTNEGPRLGDLKISTATYGAHICQIYGSMRTGGNIIWSTGLIESRHEETQEVGGKGGGGDSVTNISYTYSASFALAFCEGPITGIKKIWADNKLIYSADADASPETLIASASKLENITVYYGNEDQPADPTMEGYDGAGNVPGYRGVAYLMFKDLQLADYGNRIPNIEVEIVKNGLEDRPKYVLEKPSLAGESCTYEDGLITFGSGGFSTVYPPNNMIEMTYSTIKNDLYGNVVESKSRVIEESVFENYGGGHSIKNAPYLMGPIITGSGWASNELRFDYYRDIDNIKHSRIQTTDRLGIFGVGISSKTATYFVFTNNSALDQKIIKYRNENSMPTGVVQKTSINLRSPSFDNGEVSLFWDGQYLWALSKSSTYSYLWKFDADLNVIDQWGNYFVTGSSTITGFSVWNNTLYQPDSGNKSYKLSQLNTNGQASLIKTGFVSGNSGGCTSEKIPGFFVGNGKLVSHASLVESDVTGLGVIVSDIAEKIGLTPFEYDASELTDEVYGYAISQTSTGRGALEQLQMIYFFDVIESEGKIKFKKRGKTPVETIPLEDLGSSADKDSRGEIQNITRIQELDLPRAIRLNYYAYEADYQQGVQTAQRPQSVTASNKIAAVNVAIAMSNQKAAQTAEVLLYDSWANRDVVKILVSMKYADLEAGDVINVQFSNKTVTGRITEITNSLPGLLEMSLAQDRPSLYISQAQGSSISMKQEDITVIPYTWPELLDAPLMREADNTQGFYLAASSYSDVWNGALIYKSDDGGVNYTNTNSTFGKTLLGQAATILAAPITTNVRDDYNTVNIIMKTGTLSSISEELMFNSTTNTALLGANGRWEMIQFKNAALIVANVYRLSGIIRGIQGTEWACGLHMTDDKFVLLNETYMRNMEQSAAEQNVAKPYVVLTVGSYFDNETSQDFTNTNVRLKPFAPTHLKGVLASGDWTFTWLRRTRISGEWLDFGEKYLDETLERYDLEIYSGTTLKRTITSIVPPVEPGSQPATPSAALPYCVYTSGEMASDGMTGQNVTIKVYQISDRVGRGYAGTATFLSA